jgi:intracellular sulfur oxidation DsrE/DsrF family protein
MKAVFHHSSGDDEMHARVVNNVANLLDDETLDLESVVLVANSGGLGLLLQETNQREQVEALQERGVVFKQCRNTLDGTGTSEDDLLDGVEVVPSGVGELTRLQTEGYAYLKP